METAAWIRMTSTFHCPQKPRMVILKVLEYYGKNTGSDLRKAAAATLLPSSLRNEWFSWKFEKFFFKNSFQNKTYKLMRQVFNGDVISPFLWLKQKSCFSENSRERLL